METVSKKRGRPRLYSPEHVELCTSLVAPDLKTSRQKQARWLAQRAIDCLLDDDNVVEGVEHIFSEDGTYRVSVLEQLGRFKLETGCSADSIIDLARQLSSLFRTKRDMTVRKAVKIMRLVRAQQRYQPEQNGDSECPK